MKKKKCVGCANATKAWILAHLSGTWLGGSGARFFVAYATKSSLQDFPFVSILSLLSYS